MSWTRRGILGLGGLSVVAVAAARWTDPQQITEAAGAPRPAPDLKLLSTDPAPSLESASGWLNSPPLTLDELAGKVVLYDFWTFGCINCRRTLPAVKAWHARYADDGLVVASIHTPEFGYEAEVANIEEFVADEGIEYPIALDPDKRIWRAFANHYWPAFYLYDRDGRWRYHHIGEGAYPTTEDAIRQLLGVDAGSPRADHDLPG